MLGNKIKELRKRSKITQKDLATKLKIPQSLIAAWEADKCKPGYDNIRSLISLFGFSYKDLLDFFDLEIRDVK